MSSEISKVNSECATYRTKLLVYIRSDRVSASKVNKIEKGTAQPKWQDHFYSSHSGTKASPGSSRYSSWSTQCLKWRRFFTKSPTFWTDQTKIPNGHFSTKFGVGLDYDKLKLLWNFCEILNFRFLAIRPQKLENIRFFWKILLK